MRQRNRPLFMCAQVHPALGCSGLGVCVRAPAWLGGVGLSVTSSSPGFGVNWDSDGATGNGVLMVVDGVNRVPDLGAGHSAVVTRGLLFVAVLAELLSCVQLLWDPTDCSPPGSSVCVIFQGGLPLPSPGDPGIEPESPTLAGEFCTTEPPGKLSLTLPQNWNNICILCKTRRHRQFSCGAGKSIREYEGAVARMLQTRDRRHSMLTQRESISAVCLWAKGTYFHGRSKNWMGRRHGPMSFQKSFYIETKSQKMDVFS